MATRVTEGEVKEIMDTELTAEALRPFVRMANTLTTNALTGEGYGATTLRDIELNLAAHFACSMDQRIAAEKTGEGSVTYEGKSGLGLHGTKYGQAAMLLDHQGKLAQISAAKRRAHLHVIEVTE